MSSLALAMGRVHIFAALPPSELSIIASAARTRRYDARSIVLDEGDTAGHLLGVATGHLKVVAATAEGRTSTMGLFSSGDVFGIPALLLGQPRAARVVALTETVLVLVEKTAFERALPRCPTLSRQLLDVLAQRVLHLAGRHVQTVSLTMPQRLARMLLTLARDCAEPSPHGTVLALSLSQQELADLTNSTRQSVNKQLRSWMAAGWLTLEDNRLVLLDEAALQATASPS
ncbi:MAG: Crp/Fnr family transcriptional regulator [Nannocystales bacterium]